VTQPQQTHRKATQALVVSALRARFGNDAVTFINGDGELRGVADGRGGTLLLKEDRADVAERFNAGRVRFLVSTEAAGEGIDLQESCYTLIHLDVPWNPMRIHQRNGRLYRYGQKHQVEIISLRNPATVEARIWDLLTVRMKEIERAFVEVMDDPEDLAALVLGMTPARDIERVFERATTQSPERLDGWFQRETASFAGKYAVQTVKDIFGNVARFDFQEVASQVPRVDLPDLEAFMRRAMSLLGRKLVADGEGRYSVTIPDTWRSVPGVRLRYEGLTFQRYGGDVNNVLSGGHRLVLRSIEWARALDGAFAVVGGLSEAIAIVRLQDRVTTTNGQVQSVVVGVAIDPRTFALTGTLRDWEVLLRLNRATAPRAAGGNATPRPSLDLSAIADRALQAVASLALPFELPIAETLMVLWPAQSEGSAEEIVETQSAGTGS